MNDDNELENNIRYDLNIIEKLYSDFNLIENNIYNSKNLSNNDKNNINNALIDYSYDVQKLNIIKIFILQQLNSLIII